MNRRSTQTTAKAEEVRYPDVLGRITGGTRFALESLQVAFGLSVETVSAGSPFEGVVVLQNTVNSDIDAVLRLVVPERDLGGQQDRFRTAMTRPLRIGLRAGEVGVLYWPIETHAQTAPGHQYSLQLDISVEHKARDVRPIRDSHGGVPFDIQEFDGERLHHVEQLQHVHFSAEANLIKSTGTLRLPLTGTPQKVSLVTRFAVLPAGTGTLLADSKARYVTLWTESDRGNADRLVGDAKAQLGPLMHALSRRTVYFPLLKALQPHFEASGYKLWAGECVLIAKLIALVVEMGIPKPMPGESQKDMPRWVTRLARMSLKEADTLRNASTDDLVTRYLLHELIYDAAIYGFKILRVVLAEPLVSPDKTGEYAHQLADAITTHCEEIDLFMAYVPLVLAGLAISQRIQMPGEDLQETVLLFRRAFERRREEETNGNAAVFAVTRMLMDRALTAQQEA
jgi:hypothetical protein